MLDPPELHRPPSQTLLVRYYCIEPLCLEGLLHQVLALLGFFCFCFLVFVLILSCVSSPIFCCCCLCRPPYLLIISPSYLLITPPSPLSPVLFRTQQHRGLPAMASFHYLWPSASVWRTPLSQQRSVLCTQPRQASLLKTEAAGPNGGPPRNRLRDLKENEQDSK